MVARVVNCPARFLFGLFPLPPVEVELELAAAVFEPTTNSRGLSFFFLSRSLGGVHGLNRSVVSSSLSSSSSRGVALTVNVGIGVGAEDAEDDPEPEPDEELDIPLARRSFFCWNASFSSKSWRRVAYRCRVRSVQVSG